MPKSSSPAVTWDGPVGSLVLGLVIYAGFGTASSQWNIGQSTLAEALGWSWSQELLDEQSVPAVSSPVASARPGEREHPAGGSSGVAAL